MEYLSKKMLDLLKLRIQNEEFSSRLYQSMSQFLDYNGFSGAAKLWAKYADEEKVHASWCTQFLLDLDYLPPLPTIKEPSLEYEGLCDVIKKSYIHECEITKECVELAKAAMQESDFLTYGLAQKLVNEQVEEVAKAQAWIDKLESFGEDKIALKLLDKEMGKLA